MTDVEKIAEVAAMMTHPLRAKVETLNAALAARDALIRALVDEGVFPRVRQIGGAWLAQEPQADVLHDSKADALAATLPEPLAALLAQVCDPTRGGRSDG